MAESTLSISRVHLKRYAARKLGVSRTAGDWTSENTADINDVIQSAERMFYGAYPWSFMRVTTTVSLTAADDEVDLADSFGGFIDDFLSYVAADSKYAHVKLTGVPEILRLRQNESLYPAIQVTHAAVNWKTFDQTNGSRAELIVFPAPPGNCTLTGTAYTLPSAVSDAAPYPLGGMPQAECLVEACLAACEELMGDELGIHHQKFQALLEKSIAHDKRIGPRFLGYNGDGSTLPPLEVIRSEYVTYNGSSLIG